jgi:hypothetical protein
MKTFVNTFVTHHKFFPVVNSPATLRKGLNYFNRNGMPPLGSCRLILTKKDFMNEQERLELCRSVYKRYLDQQAQALAISAKTPSDIWEEHMKDLRTFKQKNGHCRVPRHYIDNPKLGRWVMNVRSHYQFIQKGKKSSLITGERLKQLQAIDFEFAPKNKSHTKYYVSRQL